MIWNPHNRNIVPRLVQIIPRHVILHGRPLLVRMRALRWALNRHIIFEQVGSIQLERKSENIKGGGERERETRTLQSTRDFNFVGHYLPQKSPDCNWSTYFWEASFLLIFHPHAQRPFFICTSRGIYHQAHHYYSSLFACVTSHYDSSV